MTRTTFSPTDERILERVVKLQNDNQNLVNEVETLRHELAIAHQQRRLAEAQLAHMQKRWVAVCEVVHEFQLDYPEVEG